MKATSVEDQVLSQISTAVQSRENPLQPTCDILRAKFPHYTSIFIYLVRDDDLVLEAFSGRPTEHTRIKIGQGICGAAVADKSIIVVDDVSKDPRYIACSIETKSEIVVPIWANSRIVGEIDIDSDRPAAFRNSDRQFLERIAETLSPHFSK